MRVRSRLRAVRAASWALRAGWAARRQLGAGKMPPLDLPPVPRLPATAGWAVHAALRPRVFTCLVRAAVRQAWDAAHGWRRDLIIGVRTPGENFAAHAWLDGDDPRAGEGYHELLRRGAA
jgi:transglutaminase superfamily protein